jgi:predicted RNA-binding Zn ribbon-like protein
MRYNRLVVPIAFVKDLVPSRSRLAGKRSGTPPPGPRFSLIGSRLCVDYLNTLGASGSAVDRLLGWGELVDFFASTGIIPRSQSLQLLELEHVAPGDIAAVFDNAIELRQGIRKCLEALAAGHAPGAEAVAPINHILRCTEGYDQLIQASGPGGGAGWRIEFVMRERRLEWLLAAIARSAAELIAEGPQAPIRKCGNPDCLLYFYDASRTGRRRWCSMAVCGNRSKVAAHARRARKAVLQGTN